MNISVNEKTVTISQAFKKVHLMQIKTSEIKAWWIEILEPYEVSPNTLKQCFNIYIDIGSERPFCFKIPAEELKQTEKMLKEIL